MSNEYEASVVEFALAFWGANCWTPPVEGTALAFLLSNMDDEVEDMLLKATGFNAFDLEDMLT